MEATPGARGSAIRHSGEHLRLTDEPDHAALRLSGWWVASVVAAVAHNGLWATPNLAFLARISTHLGRNPFSGAMAGDYLLTDLSLPSLARLVGETEPYRFARLHLMVLLVGWATVTAMAMRRFGYRRARTLTVILAASPLVTVSMQWLGQPDPLTGLCGIAMVLVRRRWWVFAFAVLAGVTHPEQALFMAAVAGVTRSILPPDQDSATAVSVVPRSAWGKSKSSQKAPTAITASFSDAVAEVAVAVAGVVAGRLITEVYFRLSDIVVSTPRTKFLDYGLSTFIEHHRSQPLGLLWTLWGPLWLVMVGVLVALWLQRRQPDRLPGPRLGAARGWIAAGLAVAALVPVLVTLDETRVYAVITAPLLVWGALVLSSLVDRRWLLWGSIVLLVLTALIPGGFAAGVTSWRTQLDTPAMVRFLHNGDRPVGDMSAWLLSPFDFVIPAPPGR